MGRIKKNGRVGEWKRGSMERESMMMMMNCFCGMVDRRKANLRHAVSRTWTCAAQSSGFVEWSCAVAITTTPRRHVNSVQCIVNSWEKQRACKIKGGGSGWKQVSWNSKLKSAAQEQTFVSSCSVLAGNQYRKRHDKLGKKVHWLLCKKFETKCEDKWFSHQPEPVLENDKCKILWDFAIQTDTEIEHQRPDIVVIDNEKRESLT